MEKTHQVNMAEFEAKMKSEQKAEISNMKRQMDNDMSEVLSQLEATVLGL